MGGGKGLLAFLGSRMAKEVKWPTGVTQHRASGPNSDVGAKGDVTVGPGRGQTSSRPLGRQAGTVGPPRSPCCAFVSTLTARPHLSFLRLSSCGIPLSFLGCWLCPAWCSALPPSLWGLQAKVEARKRMWLRVQTPWNVSKLPPLTEPQFAFLKNGNSENPTQHKPPARGGTS